MWKGRSYCDVASNLRSRENFREPTAHQTIFDREDDEDYSIKDEALTVRVFAEIEKYFINCVGMAPALVKIISDYYACKIPYVVFIPFTGNTLKCIIGHDLSLQTCFGCRKTNNRSDIYIAERRSYLQGYKEYPCIKQGYKKHYVSLMQYKELLYIKIRILCMTCMGYEKKEPEESENLKNLWTVLLYSEMSNNEELYAKYGICGNWRMKFLNNTIFDIYSTIPKTLDFYRFL